MTEIQQKERLRFIQSVKDKCPRAHSQVKSSRGLHTKRLAVIRRARRKAIKQSKTRFYPGVPCRHGHLDAWYSLPNQDGAVCVKCRQQNLLNCCGIPLATRPQPSACELCGKSPTSRRAFHRDYDHDTGTFRGWLCVGCNTGLGKLGDNIEGLERAIDYLRGAPD